MIIYDAVQLALKTNIKQITIDGWTYDREVFEETPMDTLISRDILKLKVHSLYIWPDKTKAIIFSKEGCKTL